MATITKGENPKKRYTVKYRDAERKQRERSFATLREAQDFKTATEHSQRLGIYADPSAGTVTLGAYAAQWIRQHHGAAGTKKNYQSVLDRHIAPEIGSIP